MESFDFDLRSIQEARDLARSGEAAAKKIAQFSEEQIDRILKSMAKAGEEHALCLGEMASEETGFGKAMDKAYKNHAASTLLYEQIKDMKTRGILAEDTVNKTIDVAEPVGLVMGIVPSTNPTSTVFFKSMVAVKSGNAIVFSPHPSAAKCTLKAAEVMRDAAIAAGAPEGIIGCVTMPSMGSTNELMKCKEVSVIIATGGPAMVKAAYSAGKPAIGVGAGNSPAYIEKTADVKHAVKTIIASKTFDYGTICASEQSIICEESNEAEVLAELKAQGGYFMTKEETDKVCGLLFKNGYTMNAKFVGRSPQVIAQAAGIEIPMDTKVLIGRQEGVGQGYPLSFEKLTTVLGFYTVKDWVEACDLSIRLLQNGIGHTMSIHTQDRDMVLKFAAKPASRILVNTGGSQGGTGISTGLPISFTLGCGTCGGSSVSENVSPKHLLNIKKVAFGLKDCSTIAADDNTFTWKEKSGATTCSPADFVASFAKKEGTQTTSCQESFDDNEKLAALVKEIVMAMKGQ
ncbi:MAG TPA: acetaldehyde dehydrogenase (acetylating) [Lachnoclostridium phytofermentans]|uniref:Acetaldehyde dehydrogenase (Acetylating) n=1 Tax=Lachnoclostridium phytofermentans TaxID=66219 RepID=A0A3D2X3R0_9FIRM|nr:acetaldehyde dehydrogenase (acetylating) [Lachnoclostridium sp.]HCL01544.1 acetaldehyde dehydrogenase (acetylating) [Lachnoclostridium phytofermentans]